jgi:hypothetical protein
MKNTEYWTLAQGVVWVCTRDEKEVQKIKNPRSVDALLSQLLEYRQGIRRNVRDRVDGTRSIRLRPEKYSFHEIGTEALDELTEAILSGGLHHHARHADTGRWAPIPEPERIYLKFRIQPDDPDRPYGFGRSDSMTLKYVTPDLWIQDLKRLFPAPRPPRTAAADQRVLERLRTIMAEKVLTKPQAREACRDVPGYFDRAFDRVWKDFPAELKIGRGKHGPRLKP